MVRKRSNEESHGELNQEGSGVGEKTVQDNTSPPEDLSLTLLKPKVREYIKQHMKLYAFVLKEQHSVFKNVDEAELFIYEQFSLLGNDYL